MRSFQIPKTFLPIALAATKAYIQKSGKTEAAPQGCDRQGIPGRDSNGQLPEGGFGLPLFHSILSGSASPCLQNPRGLGREAPVLITFYPQILRKSHFFLSLFSQGLRLWATLLHLLRRLLYNRTVFIIQPSQRATCCSPMRVSVGIINDEI